MQGLFETISTVSIILFCAGIVLLLIEMFIPGIGIFGGLGLLSLILAIIFQAQNFVQGLVLFAILGAIVTVLLFVVGRSFGKGFLYRSSLVLKDNEDKDKGYVSNADLTDLAGKTGTSLTILRPAGVALIDGEKTDVVTEGEFIPAGEKIEVIKAVGRRIIVKKAED